MRRSRLLLAIFVLGCTPRETTTEPVVLPPAPTASAVTSAPSTSAPSATPVAPPPVSNGLDVAARDPRPTPRDVTAVARDLIALQLRAATPGISSSEAESIDRKIAEGEVELRKRGAEPGSKAIAAYEGYLSKWAQASDRDEVEYYLAIEYELTGDSMRARRALYELIKSSPQSPFVAFAYFGFGEMFAREGKGDPSKLALATQAYAEALKHQGPIAADTMWRLGQLEDAQGNAAKAQSWYAKLRASFPDSSAATRIGEPL